jgi:thiol-disulfide isomerase/thioredoxin
MFRIRNFTPPDAYIQHASSYTNIRVFFLLFFAIDFWTTKCTSCPSALDKLDSMAKDSKYANVQFVSICVDQLDGARNIIEKDDDLRWQNVAHFFMSQSDKEEAKKLLGFKSVPFYVVLNECGDITQLGNEKTVDFEAVPGVVRKDNSFLFDGEEEKENYSENLPVLQSKGGKAQQVQVHRVFVMDDLDF